MTFIIYKVFYFFRSFFFVSNSIAIPSTIKKKEEDRKKEAKERFCICSNGLEYLRNIVSNLKSFSQFILIMNEMRKKQFNLVIFVVIACLTSQSSGLVRVPRTFDDRRFASCKYFGQLKLP